MSVLAEINFDANHTFISVKLHLTRDNDVYEEQITDAEQMDLWQRTVDQVYPGIQKYLTDYGLDIVASSVGIHLQGKRENPHAHYHYLVKIKGGAAKKNGVKPSNPSNNRKDWLKKNPGFTLGESEFKYQELDPKKNHHVDMLAYPMKEGIVAARNYYIYKNEIMTDEMYDAMLAYAKSLFAAAQAEKTRKERAAEGSYSVLCDILDIAKMGRNKFTNLQEMREYLDVHYISNLKLNDYPRPNDYKINCQKVAVALGIAKYSEF